MRREEKNLAGMARSKYQEVVALYQNNDLRVPPEIKKLESRLVNIDDDLETLVGYFQQAAAGRCCQLEELIIESKGYGL